jgi:hypothetical protein
VNAALGELGRERTVRLAKDYEAEQSQLVEQKAGRGDWI